MEAFIQRSLQRAMHDEPSLLVAMPHLDDDSFRKRVVLLLHYGQEGATGLVINHPTQVTVDELLFDLNSPPAEAQQQAILMGGPARRDWCWSLHSNDFRPPKSVPMGSYLCMTQTHILLNYLVDGRPPRFYMMGVGCARWKAGQLDAEIERHDWYLARFDATILECGPHQRWHWMLDQLGLTMHTTHSATA